ncbi:MAG: hypothetical protein RLZZ74_3425 [Cyanobacteriota bacterium]|jgi:hypothetical protein
MNKKYIFKYRKKFLWKKIEVIGHKLEGNTMALYLENGGIQTIPNWDQYSLKLGVDWVIAVKENMESQTGTDIKLAVKVK